MFIPKRILFMKGSLDYQVGRQIHAYFKDNSKVEIIELGNHGIKRTYQEMTFPNSIDMAKGPW